MRLVTASLDGARSLAFAWGVTAARGAAPGQRSAASQAALLALLEAADPGARARARGLALRVTVLPEAIVLHGAVATSDEEVALWFVRRLARARDAALDLVGDSRREPRPASATRTLIQMGERLLGFWAGPARASADEVRSVLDDTWIAGSSALCLCGALESDVASARFAAALADLPTTHAAPERAQGSTIDAGDARFLRRGPRDAWVKGWPRAAARAGAIEASGGEQRAAARLGLEARRFSVARRLPGARVTGAWLGARDRAAATVLALGATPAELERALGPAPTAADVQAARAELLGARGALLSTPGRLAARLLEAELTSGDARAALTEERALASTTPLALPAASFAARVEARA